MLTSTSVETRQLGRLRIRHGSRNHLTGETEAQLSPTAQITILDSRTTPPTARLPEFQMVPQVPHAILSVTIACTESITSHISSARLSLMNQVRIGIVGLGRNTRDRHVPGFRAIEGVEIVSVCNRTPESARRAAEEFAIPKTFDSWEALVRDNDIDAVMIGTWPYVHCPITLAALEHRKHVLTEARNCAPASLPLTD